MKTCYDPCFIGIEVASRTLVLVQYNTIPSLLACSRRSDSPIPPPWLFFLLTSLRVVPAIWTPETGYVCVAIACVAGGILVPVVLSWRQSLHAKRGKIPSATFLMSFECRPLFVTLVGTIWLPNQEEWCNTKLTCKRARPSVTIKSRTKTTACCKLDFISFPHERTNFPLGDSRDAWEISIIIWLAFYRFSAN